MDRIFIRLSSLFLFFLFLVPHLALAERYILFKDGKPFVTAAEYSSISNQLKKDDVIEFSDGEEYVLAEFRGKGNTTQIWKINKPGRVLRFPTGDYSFTSFEGSRGYLNEWIEAHPILKKWGGPGMIPEMYHFKKGEFAEIEDFKPEMTLGAFLDNKHPQSSEEMKKVTDDLVIFSKKLARFKYILDFKGDNVGYVSGRGWKFFDWRNSMEVYETHQALEDSYTKVESGGPGLVGNTVFFEITMNTMFGHYPVWMPIHRQVLGALFNERQRLVHQEIAPKEN